MITVVYTDNTRKQFEDFNKIVNYEDIIKLYCNNNQITSLQLNMMINLEELFCGSNNKITNLDNLPHNLEYLHCSDNKITSLDNLPPNLKELNCSNNQINSLDNLPHNLKVLHCSYNQITNLDNLPLNLKRLYCSYNQITNLDNLPPNLIYLSCSDNQITSLDNLPHNLEYIYCNNNQITSLDNIPTNLIYINCYNNPIHHLIKTYFDDDFKKYSIWRKKCLKNFIFKIEDWFLECKYNPKYKYCKLIQIKGLYKIGAIDKNELDKFIKYIKIDI